LIEELELDYCIENYGPLVCYTLLTVDIG